MIYNFIFIFQGISHAKLQEIKKAMEFLNLNVVHQGPAKTADEAARKHFEFWDTQPVPKIGCFILFYLIRYLQIVYTLLHFS